MSKETSKGLYGTVVKPCGCASAYQDAKYGAGNRVWNRGTKDKKVTLCCTVCGRKVSQ